MTRLLVTGATGQLGTELLAVASARGVECIGTAHADVDIVDAHAVMNVVEKVRPTHIIHAAAWTAVDNCEADPSKALAVNGQGTANVAAAARRAGAHVTYVSTDYVFDGTKVGPYVETDRTNPVSSYGRSKLAGEQALSSLDAIVRISWVCGYTGGNMVKTILRIAENQEVLSFVDDQRGHPTFADDAGARIVDLALANVAGIWHVTNQGEVSWFEFAREVLIAAGLDPDRVRPILTADLQPPRPAPRPANSVLQNKAMSDAGWPMLDDFRVPLKRLVDRLMLDSTK